MFPSFGDYNGNFVHPRIAVGGCVRPQHVETLVGAGIRGVVNAISVARREHLAYLGVLPSSVYWQQLGTWDGGYMYPDSRIKALTEGKQDSLDPVYAQYMVEDTVKIVRDFSPVLIHCGGGVARSGNLAAIAYAALEDVTVEEAIARMQKHRPQIAKWNPRRWSRCDVPKLVRFAQDILAMTECYTGVNTPNP